MKAVILLFLVGAALAAPGGYTGIGGVYKNMKTSHDVMSHAMKASQMALNLFEDESLTIDDEDRRVRQRRFTSQPQPVVELNRPSRDDQASQVYVPSFFTSQPRPVVELNRPSRDAQASQYYDLPLYYQEYAPRQQQ